MVFLVCKSRSSESGSGGQSGPWMGMKVLHLPGRLAGPVAADSGGFLLHCSYITSKCPWGCAVRFC